jgi:hypothetical protein
MRYALKEPARRDATSSIKSFRTLLLLLLLNDPTENLTDDGMIVLLLQA